ncbi:hypothetical protein ANCDUO_09125 [Ancylostoma duodenale]|uniref:Uncharacterized protein n=1 Tax=Ancylostoma duodenale TaxID=51022 RepID=A0A0C2GHE3_9BILA|nr:hypothetical protein ANCDUO_09125 [Ancylostoma duodenale]
MDDIVWIREEPPAEEQKPNDTLQNSDIVIVDHPQEQAPSTAQNGAAATNDDGAVEIPVIIEFKSTEVPFYKRAEEQQPPEEPPKVEQPQAAPQEEPKNEPESQEGDIVVEVYDPTSTTVPAPQPVAVEVYDPTSTTVPAPVPVDVEVFDPTSTEVPVIIDHTTPEIRDEAAKKPEEPKQEQPVVVAPVEPVKPPEPVQNAVNEKPKEEDGFDISECERKLNEATAGTKDLVNKLCDKSKELNQATQSIANE